MDAQPERPAVALGDPGDPIEYLKALSTDAEGREMLAILLEVLEAGFVHVEPGTSEELYVWPYFAQVPLESLTPSQLVELFTLITAADYEDMRSYGSYTFFRVGIAPDGRWLFSSPAARRRHYSAGLGASGRRILACDALPRP
jgi:hypothetical protein